jgi:GH24 family phage-related lysozyme (muramidase)
MKRFIEILNPQENISDRFISIEEQSKMNIVTKIGAAAIAGGFALGGLPHLSGKSQPQPQATQSSQQVQPQPRLTPPVIQAEKPKPVSQEKPKPTEKVYHHDTIRNMVIGDEGIKTQTYMDTAGFRTVGIGHNLDAPNSKSTFLKTFGEDGHALHASVKAGGSITHEQAHKLFDTDYEHHLNKTIKMIPNLHEHPPEVQAVLVSGTYRGHVGDAPMFRKKFNSGDIESAAHEVLNRKEYKNPERDEKGKIKAPGVLTRLERDHSVLMDYAKTKSQQQ